MKELLLTNRGEAIGVYVGIDAWRDTQKMLALLRTPEALTRSLAYHREFKKTGDSVGISLDEFEAKQDTNSSETGLNRNDTSRD